MTPALWDTGAFHIEGARNVNLVRSLAMSVIRTLEDVSVLCLQRVRLVNVVELEPGTRTRDARNVVVTQLDLLEDNVMLKVATVDVSKDLRELIVTSVALAITISPTAEPVTAILLEQTHQRASK